MLMKGEGGTHMSKKRQHSEDKQSLKGTFVSVMIVGVVIAVCWIGVFMLFINRG